MFRVLKYLLLVLLVAAPVSAKYWDGAAWVDNTCNYYNGSGWVPCDESYYNGTAWVPVNDGTPPTDYTLTVTDPGNSDVITCDDTDLSTVIDCGNGATDCSATTTIDAEVTGMTATAASGRQFDAWGGDITGTENPTTTPLVMNGNKNVTASFSGSGTPTLVYIGWDNTNGVPIGEPTSNYGAKDVTVTTLFVATEDGTLKTLNAFIVSAFSPEQEHIVVYRDIGGTITLVGSGNYVGADEEWTGAIEITPENGQTLEFSTGDSIYFGGSASDDSDIYRYGREDAGGDGMHWNEDDVSSGPLPTITFTISNDRKMGFILGYEPN